VCAYEFKVTVHESKGEAHLDHAHFEKALGLAFYNGPHQLEIPPLTVHGEVESDLIVETVGGGKASDGQKIYLGTFVRTLGKDNTPRKLATVKLRMTKTGHGLEKVRVEPPEVAAGISITRLEQDKTAGGTTDLWWLELSQTGTLEAGTLRPESVVVLRNTRTKREIRIPLVGNATRD
jgi:hypothetical protein